MKTHRSVTKNRFAGFLLAALSLVLASPANAALFCAGKLKSVATEWRGGVLVSVDGATPMHTICNIETQGGYKASVAACKTMYATLLSARISDREIRLYYDDPTLTSCSQITAWSYQPSFYFVEIP